MEDRRGAKNDFEFATPTTHQFIFDKSESIFRRLMVKSEKFVNENNEPPLIKTSTDPKQKSGTATLK